MFPEISQWLAEHGYGDIIKTRDVTTHRGCDYGRLKLSSGRSLFVKHNPAAPDSMFHAEAEGLRALGAIPEVRVPEVVHAAPNYILLEDIGDGDLDRDSFFVRMGRCLANVHKAQQDCFGWPIDSFCGATRQINTRMDNGYEFFAEYRLRHLTRLSFDEGLLNRKLVAQLDSIADRLPTLVPDHPPVLLHGDFWTGNAHCAANGDPVMIDPACYWGWPETDIAMTILFAGYSDDFYSSYGENFAQEPGWQERAPIYNLYHLLNHLYLFGEAYHNRIAAICDRFAD